MRDLRITISKDKRPERRKPWLVRWYDEYNPTTDTQKRHSKSFSKRKQAEQFAQQLKDDYGLGISSEQKKITLGDFLGRFLQAKKNEYKVGTYGNYEDTIARLNSYFNPQTPIHTIGVEYAEHFIANLDYIQDGLKGKKRFSDSARNIHLRNCKKMFKTAVRWKYLRTNPFEEIKQVKAQTKPWHYIAPDEFQSILNVCKDPYMKAFYAVQYGCGFRAGEAMSLLWDGSNIDFNSNRLTIFNRTATTDIPPYSIKDFESRSVLMPDWVVGLLLELHEQTSELNPYVFLNDRRWKNIHSRWAKLQNAGKANDWDKRVLLYNTLAYFKRCCKRAGIKTHENSVNIV